MLYVRYRKCSVEVGNSIRSKILIAGHRSETGLYEVDSCAGFPGFSNGMIVERFHISGMVQVCRDKLKIVVRYFIPKGPMCFRCIVAILSGPCALDALAFFIASYVISSEISKLSFKLSGTLFAVSVVCTGNPYHF